MDATSLVKHVLLKEVDNENGVYLYLEGNEWCAYERSAYYLISLNAPVRIECEIVREGYDIILMKAFFQMDDMRLPLAPKTILKNVADDRLLFQVEGLSDGFFEWKQSQLMVLQS